MTFVQFNAVFLKYQTTQNQMHNCDRWASMNGLMKFHFNYIGN